MPFLPKNHPSTSDLSQILVFRNFLVNDTCHHICAMKSRALKDFKNGFTSIVAQKSTELERFEILKTFNLKYVKSAPTHCFKTLNIRHQGQIVKLVETCKNWYRIYIWVYFNTVIVKFELSITLGPNIRQLKSVVWGNFKKSKI